MLTENIQGTVKNVQNLVANLKTFNWLIRNFAGSPMSRINIAIREINKMAINDLGQLRVISNGCKQVYDSQFAITVDSVLHQIQALNWELRGQNHEDRPQWHDTIDNLRASLENMKMINKLILPPMKFSPNRFWRDDRGKICQDMYTVMANNISTLLYGNVVNVTNRKTDSPNSAMENQTIAPVVQCTIEYKSIVDGTEQIILSYLDEANEALENDLYFSFDKVLHIASDDLAYITDAIVHLEDMLVNYSRNHTTKLSMSSFITKNNRTYLEKTLDRVLSRIVTRALVPLQTMTENSEINIKKWVHGSLSALGKLVPYFDNDNIDHTARNLTIWRYPLLRMNSNKILKFKYKQNETWITWPQSNNILEMLKREDDKALLKEILTSYGNDLTIEIYKLQSQFSSAKKDILSAVDTLMADMQSFRRQSEIDQDFIA